MEDFEELKKLISSILISSPLKMTVQKLNRDFGEQIGFDIPYSKFGFRSLEQCLHAMEDILEVRGIGMDAQILVHVSSKVAHMDKLITHQKVKARRRQHFGHRPKPQSKRPKAIPIRTDHRSGNVPSNVQYRQSVSSPEQIGPPFSLASPEFGSYKHLTHILPNKHVSERSDVTEETSTMQPLMLKPISPPKDFVYHGKGTRTSHNTTKCETLNDHQISPISRTGQPILSTMNVHINQSSPYINNFDFKTTINECKDNVVSNYYNSHLGAITKESTFDTNQQIEDDENADIYSSDEEEPLNTRVPLKVQQNLISLIDRYEEGIWCTKIPQAYQQMFNKYLDYEEYGYKSLIQMCMDLKSIFFWFRPDKGDFKLYDRRKPPPKDLDKHYKQSEYIKSWSYLSAQPSNEPAIADVEELVNIEVEDYYPPDVVHLGEEISRQFIPEYQEDEYIDVCVGEVYDPSKFWVMLSENTPLLDKLMDDMQSYYSDCPELKIPPNMIKMGLYCAAVYNHEYHRAIIVKFMPKSKDRVKVFYVDYGTASSALTSSLHFLHKKFYDLPQQAIRARLARIYPPIANSAWSSESSSRLLDLVRMKNLVAHLYRIDYTQQILEVFLVDTSGDEDVYMNDALVEEGYAIFTYEDQQPAPVDPYFIPRVKYLHLIPTFDELEQGAVPNAYEMTRLEKMNVSLEQILNHYFIQVNFDDMPTIEGKKKQTEESKTEKKSSVAMRRSQLQVLTENKSVQDNEENFFDKSLVSMKEHRSELKSSEGRNSPSPEVVVAKPTIRPPPGFESIQQQEIKITSQKVNGGETINTIVTQTTNIGATADSNTQNLLNYMFNNSALSNQRQPPVCNTNVPFSGVIQQLEAQNIMHELMLLGNQLAPQQAQILGNRHIYPPQQMVPHTYQNHNLFNVANQQFTYPNNQNMQPVHMPNMQPSYYKQAPTPIRLHMQESIRELLLNENRVILNRFLCIIKKRLLSPGEYHGLFRLIPDIINKSIIYPRNTLENLYKEALNYLNDDDIIDLATEAKSLFNESNSAATQTQHTSSAQVDTITQQVQQLRVNNMESRINTNNSTPIIPTKTGPDQTIIDCNKLVFEIAFENTKLHIINLQNRLHVMVTEILEIVNQKMPIERVRKIIVMTDPSISVLDIRLQDHKQLVEELSRYIHMDSSHTLHVISIIFVPKLINIIANRKDIASNFDEFLVKLHFSNKEGLIS